MSPAQERRHGDRPGERRCCTGMLAVWNVMHGVNAVEVDPDRDAGHRPLDLVAHDPARSLWLTIEHGALHTVDESPRAERFVVEEVAPALQNALSGLLQGASQLRLFTTQGRVPPDIVDEIITVFRRSPSLLAPGDRLIEINGRAVGRVHVNAEGALRKRLLVGPEVQSSPASILHDLHSRLRALVAEVEKKYSRAGTVTAPGDCVHRVLLVEADDVWNLSDVVYARLFDAAAGDARRTGLSAMWRVAADGTDEVQFWQEWDAEMKVPPMRRFFRWLDADGSVHEV